MRPDISGKKCTLLPAADGKGYELHVEGGGVIPGPNARKLSHWALAEGAAEVRWSFDYKKADE